MWLFVMFDLPTNTKVERRNATLFRKALEKDGFTMMQYSVYIRHCASKESMNVHIKRLRNNAVNIYFIAEGKIGKYSSGIAVCRSTQNFTAYTAAFFGHFFLRKPIAQRFELFAQLIFIHYYFSAISCLAGS